MFTYVSVRRVWDLQHVSGDDRDVSHALVLLDSDSWVWEGQLPKQCSRCIYTFYIYICALIYNSGRA